MARVSIGDAELHYESQGEGPPVILVPGLSGNASFWAPQIAQIAARHRAITFDHRGVGASTPSRIRYSVEQMADDVVRLMDALNIERAALVGHSTGGCIGAVIALDHPGRLSSLVMSSSWTTADAYFSRLFEARRAVLERQGIEAYVRHGSLFQYPPWWIAANAEALAAAEARAIANFPPTEIVLSRIEAILAYDRTADLGRIDIPVLVHAPRDDAITPPYYSEALHERIPGSRLHVIERGGHFCPVTVPDAFRAAVLAFLAEHA